MKPFSGFRSACKIANPIANQCAILPFTFHSSRTRECAREQGRRLFTLALAAGHHYRSNVTGDLFRGE
jgi:hypothetical protein